MSKPENALSRWSRLKRQSASQGREAGKTPPRAAEATGHATNASVKESDRKALAAPFDVESLPPIESIVAGSDIRAFLQKGVPAALTRAALRQAWVSDPAIRDFIEIAENQWDFTHPEKIPGFGPLAATDEVQSLIAQALGELRNEAKSLVEGQMGEGKVPPSPGGDAPIGALEAGKAHNLTFMDPGQMPGRDPEAPRALQHEDSAVANTEAPPRKPRRHGGAMPS
jgi:Protein of unknown function (DUF3306)